MGHERINTSAGLGSLAKMIRTASRNATDTGEPTASVPETPKIPDKQPLTREAFTPAIIEEIQRAIMYVRPSCMSWDAERASNNAARETKEAARAVLKRRNFPTCFVRTNGRKKVGNHWEGILEIMGQQDSPVLASIKFKTGEILGE